MTTGQTNQPSRIARSHHRNIGAGRPAPEIVAVFAADDDDDDDQYSHTPLASKSVPVSPTPTPATKSEPEPKSDSQPELGTKTNLGVGSKAGTGEGAGSSALSVYVKHPSSPPPSEHKPRRSTRLDASSDAHSNHNRVDVKERASVKHHGQSHSRSADAKVEQSRASRSSSGPHRLEPHHYTHPSREGTDVPSTQDSRWSSVAHRTRASRVMQSYPRHTDSRADLHTEAPRYNGERRWEPSGYHSTGSDRSYLRDYDRHRERYYDQHSHRHYDRQCDRDRERDRDGDRERNRKRESERDFHQDRRSGHGVQPSVDRSSYNDRASYEEDRPQNPSHLGRSDSAGVTGSPSRSETSVENAISGANESSSEKARRAVATDRMSIVQDRKPVPTEPYPAGRSEPSSFPMNLQNRMFHASMTCGAQAKILADLRTSDRSSTCTPTERQVMCPPVKTSNKSDTRVSASGTGIAVSVPRSPESSNGILAPASQRTLRQTSCTDLSSSADVGRDGRHQMRPRPAGGGHSVQRKSLRSSDACASLIYQLPHDMPTSRYFQNADDDRLDPASGSRALHEGCDDTSMGADPRGIASHYSKEIRKAMRARLTKTSSQDLDDADDDKVRTRSMVLAEQIRLIGPWKWDQDSVGPKPLPSARAVTVSDLDVLTKHKDILSLFSRYGKVDTDNMKFLLHNVSGEFLGVCWIPFLGSGAQDLQHGPDTGLDIAQRSAKQACYEADGIKLDGSTIKVVLDGQCTHFDRLQMKARRKAEEVSRDEKRRAREALERERSINDARARKIRPNESPDHVKVAQREALVREVEAKTSHISHPEHDETANILENLCKEGRKYAFIDKSKLGVNSPAEICASFIDKQLNVTRIQHDKSAWYLSFQSDSDGDRAKIMSHITFNNIRLPYEIREVPTIHDVQKVKRGSGGKARELRAEGGSARLLQEPFLEEQQLPKTGWSENLLVERLKLLTQEAIKNRFRKDIETQYWRQASNLFNDVGEAIAQAQSPHRRITSVSTLQAASVHEAASEGLSKTTVCGTKVSMSMLVAPEEGREGKIIRSEVTEQLLQQSLPASLEKNLVTASEGSDTDGSTVAERARKRMKKAHERQQEDRAQTAARSSKDIEAAQAGSAFRCASRHLALDERQESDRPPVPAASPEPDLFELGLVQDEEDFYYVKLVLEKLRSGEELNEADLPDPREDIDGNDQELDTGSAKTQGFFKIPARDKAKHMPDRNKAIIDTSAAAALASARDNRADSRRFVANLEQHKRESASDTDVLKFNQLRTRKKQLKFAKSPIHDWGLYAMEVIPKGDMVIEYVGEIIRQQVADEREKAQELAGIFSTYLFRVDDDTVVDATHKGNIARLMNHCCTPNCTAKILTLNGEKKIVIYAKEPILPGQELTYDYKFQASAGDEDAIPCLCGSSGCRRFL